MTGLCAIKGIGGEALRRPDTAGGLALGIGFGLGVDRTVLALAGRGQDEAGTPGATCSACRSAGGKLRLAVLAGRLRAAGVRVTLLW